MQTIDPFYFQTWTIKFILLILKNRIKKTVTTIGEDQSEAI